MDINRSASYSGEGTESAPSSVPERLRSVSGHYTSVTVETNGQLWSH